MMSHSIAAARAPSGSVAGVPVHVHGLGELGFELASRLAAAGAQVAGFDIHPQAQTRWSTVHAVTPVDPPRVVVLCVTDEAASRSLVDQHLHRWLPGTVVIEHGTVSPACARDTARRCKEAALRYIDAPLSGGADGARRGVLVAMLGAEPADRAVVMPVLGAYCAHVVPVGAPGDGQTCKLANQLAIAGIAAGLAVAQRFALANGLNLETVFTALAQGSAQSVQLDRLQAVLGNPTPAAAERFAWLRKDLDHCAEVSDSSQPLVALWRDLWASSQASCKDPVS